MTKHFCPSLFWHQGNQQITLFSGLLWKVVIKRVEEDSINCMGKMMTNRPPKDGVKGGNCKTAYKGRLWCYIEEIDGNVYCKDATKSRKWVSIIALTAHHRRCFSSYSGTYWSYDACFTPARTDQLCQLVVAEGKTKCNTLSGTGRREVGELILL